MSSGPGSYHRYMPRSVSGGKKGAETTTNSTMPAYRPAMAAAATTTTTAASADARERVVPIYPLAIMVGVILIIVGALETLWLVQTLAGLWYMPHAELLPQLPGISWMVAVQSPAALALPLGAWLLAAPASGRIAVTALLGVGVGFTLGTHDPLAAGDLVRTTGQAGLFAATIILLWIERGLIGTPTQRPQQQQY